MLCCSITVDSVVNPCPDQRTVQCLHLLHQLEVNNNLCQSFSVVPVHMRQLTLISSVPPQPDLGATDHEVQKELLNRRLHMTYIVSNFNILRDNCDHAIYP
jgi:hypothetical protein